MDVKVYKILVESVENYNLNIHINQYYKSSKHPYPHGLFFLPNILPRHFINPLKISPGLFWKGTNDIQQMGIIYILQ